MNLQPNETTLLTSNDNKVMLTNIRISGDFKDLGYAHKIFIYLEDISSIQVVYRSSIVFVVLAVVLGIFGLWSASQRYMTGASTLAILLALVFSLFWYFTRKRVIAIYPDGGKPLEVAANQMREETINDFLEKVQLAKSERIRLLRKL